MCRIGGFCHNRWRIMLYYSRAQMLNHMKWDKHPTACLRFEVLILILGGIPKHMKINSGYYISLLMAKLSIGATRNHDHGAKLGHARQVEDDKLVQAGNILARTLAVKQVVTFWVLLHSPQMRSGCWSFWWKES